MILRTIGRTKAVEAICTGLKVSSIIRNGTGVIGIFQRNIVTGFYQIRVTSPDGPSSGSSTNKPINYKALNHLFQNPHSIVWLYCGGDTPYIDLSAYFSAPNHHLTLY